MAPMNPGKLRNSLQGVLAGGGSSVSAPLLSLGPFWRLLVVVGAGSAVAQASLWLAAMVLVVVALICAVTIGWMQNGHGVSGLSETEFGGWAIKLNGAVTFVLCVTAFLASLVAALTLVVDRFPILDQVALLGIDGRSLLGVGLALSLGWLVNNRPRQIAVLYGPATAAVLALMWSLVLAAVINAGRIQPPTAQAEVSSSIQALGMTIAGLARLLAVVVGMEIFTTLGPAFQGDTSQRTAKAMGSLALATITTLSVLLIFGPAMLRLVDPSSPASAFTQAMQDLLPAPLAWLGSAIGVIALLTVAAASAQALQNLSLGLRSRRYAPAFLAQRNTVHVPFWPVRILTVVAVLSLLLVGSQEGAYVSLYVTGTLLLLVLAGWAAWRRGRREATAHRAPAAWLRALALLVVALILSVAGAVALIDGFVRGSWVYLLAGPLLYAVFHFTRRKMGSPNPLQEALGQREGAMRGLAQPAMLGSSVRARLPSPELAPAEAAKDRGVTSRWEGEPLSINRVVVALDGSDFAERALPAAAAISQLFDANLTFISVLSSRGVLRVLPHGRSAGNPLEAGQAETEAYLGGLVARYRAQGLRADYYLAAGPVAQAIDVLTRELAADLLIMSTHGRSGVSRFMLGSNASALLKLLRVPLVLLRPQALAVEQLPALRRVLVTLDGSGFAEQVLPWVLALSAVTRIEALLLTVPEVPEPSLYGAMADAVNDLRVQAEANAQRYMMRTASRLRDLGVPVRPLVEGSRPATAILDVAEREHVDLIMLATHGRGGMERLFLGSVADRVVHHSRCPVLLIPARNGDS